MSDANYYNDHRVRAGAERRDTFIVEDDDGLEHELPTKWAVCPTCEGRGTHVNPSIDSDGLTADFFADDPDFAADYLSGTYDVPCYGCGGQRVVAVIDEARCTPALLALYREREREEADYQAMCRFERSMGA